MTNRAILSLYDKTELTTLGRRLHELGWELIASGGTARALRNAGLPVTDVAEVTGAPEMLSGRVKTLHPAIHGAILARDSAEDRAELEKHGIAPIDLVVCNLYPFQETISRSGVTPQEAVEQIDIGGVTLLRAAAKNYERVTALCDPADYEQVLQELEQNGQVSTETRRVLAAKAFAHTRNYDTAIAAYFESLQPQQAGDEMPQSLQLNLQRVQSLRYGENPHQAAALYSENPSASPLGGKLLQGKPLSYNNLLDLDAACRTVASFEQPTVVIVKHLSPCGIASHPRTLAQAFPHALASDPVSAFGGVIAVNRPVEEQFTEALDEAGLFVEAVLAPEFSPGARDWFATHKKNCRLLALDPDETPLDDYSVRSVLRGFLVQSADNGDPGGDTKWRVVSEREPDVAEWEALKFAWQAVLHVQSNAIVFATTLEGEGSATVGIGGGLPSRVDAVRLAAAKAGERAQEAVMASDAFFPFPDGIEVAAAAGVTAVIQPGGSIRDEQVIDAANRLGLALVFSGTRHFRH